MSTRMSKTHLAALLGTLGAMALAGKSPERFREERKGAGGATRRERTPEQSAERLSARQERMRRKAAKRAHSHSDATNTDEG